jgi:predicted NUDIX family phosphoesterase
VILRHGRELLHYTRGSNGTETRLRAQRSVGIGGHISAADANATDPYRAGMLRELGEEVRISTAFREQTFGLINDDSTPVGSVHLGIVHLMDLDEPCVTSHEEGIVDASFAPLSQLLDHRGEFESWSRLAMEALENSEQFVGYFPTSAH